MIFCMHEGCDGPTKVMETRGSIRRRKCFTCGRNFMTEEVEYKMKREQANPFTEKWKEHEHRRRTTPA